MANDLYLLLGVQTDASPEEIKAAFRKRAKQLHPDYHGKDAEPFLKVQQAYSVLSDPDRRRHYDQSMMRTTAARRPRAEPMRAPGFRRFHTHQFTIGKSAAGYEPSFEELFDRLWSNFTLSVRPKAERLKPLTVEVPLSRAEAFYGGSVTILVPARAECPSCAGVGSVGPYECWQCQGQGAITAEVPVQIEYPAGIQNECTVQVPLSGFGITNFFLAVRFRITAEL